MILLGIRHPIF